MFKDAADKLNRQYIEGTIAHIRKFHHVLYQKTNRAEDRINEVWKAALQGKADIEEFREVLKQWYLLQVQSIKIFSKEQKKK